MSSAEFSPGDKVERLEGDLVDHDTDPTPCPVCGDPNDGALGGAEPPEPGDLAVCFGCGSLLIYTDELGLREPTDAERATLLANPEVVRVMASVIDMGVRMDARKEKP